MGSIDLLISGVLSSSALIYLSPAALPSKSAESGTFNAFMTSLALACTFLLTDAVSVTAQALWGTVAAFMLTVFFAFLFAQGVVWAIIPKGDRAGIIASAAVLVLTQPTYSERVDTVMSALGTAVGAVVLITALSPALKRIKLSDAPECIKGLPSMLIILGLAALAFGGF